MPCLLGRLIHTPHQEWPVLQLMNLHRYSITVTVWFVFLLSCGITNSMCSDKRHLSDPIYEFCLTWSISLSESVSAWSSFHGSFTKPWPPLIFYQPISFAFSIQLNLLDTACQNGFCHVVAFKFSSCLCMLWLVTRWFLVLDNILGQTMVLFVPLKASFLSLCFSNYEWS